MAAEKLKLDTWGARAAFAMEVRGVGNNELEQLAGLSKGEGTRIRGRKRSDPDKIGRVAKALNVSVEWLTSGTGPAPTKADPRTVPTTGVQQVVYDPVNAKEAVAQTPTYRTASPAVQRAFDQRAPYTPNEKFPDFDAYIKFLLRLKDNADLLEPPAGAEPLEDDEDGG